VPRLTQDRRNETIRFVMLVDTLYEAGTRLFASAEDSPDRLCEEGPHAFEFTRTASRLIEMQGADYLARRRT